MFSKSYSETVANPVYHKLIEFNILIETLLKESFDNLFHLIVQEMTTEHIHQH